MVSSDIAGMDVFRGGTPWWEALNLWISTIPTGQRLILLGGELFVLVFVLPWIFFRSGLFSPTTSRIIAAAAAGIIYTFLPDPVNISFLDDLFVFGLLAAMLFPLFYRSRGWKKSIPKSR